MGRITNLIERGWRPEKWYRGKGAHNRFRDDLAEFLDDNLRYTVNTESRTGRADIEIGDDIAVEVKRKMDSNSKVGNAFSDVSEYTKFYSGIVVVVCGGKKRYVKRLKERIRKEVQSADFGLQQNKISVVWKRKDGKGKRKDRSRKQGGSNLGFGLQEGEDLLGF